MNLLAILNLGAAAFNFGYWAESAMVGAAVFSFGVFLWLLKKED